MVLNSIISLGSLETFIRRETGIDEGAAQAYLLDGRRLKTENVRELDGLQDQVCSRTPDEPDGLCIWPKQAFPYTFVSQALTFVQTIFVFNNYYVHKDIDEAMKLLYQQPTLHLPIQGMVLVLHVEDTHNI